MPIPCSACGAPMTCQPEGGCWCMDLPPIAPLPADQAAGCLCRPCLIAHLARLRAEKDRGSHP